MYLVSLGQHWLESLLGFIHLVAQTLTVVRIMTKKTIQRYWYCGGSLDLLVGWLSKGLIVARDVIG